MKITSSESKGKLERSGKGLITSLGFKTKARSQKYKKASYAIRNVSEKEIYKIIREFEKFEKFSYEKKRPKHEPTESYFHLARQITKCMTRSNNLNWYDHGGYTEMTAPYSKVNVTNEGEQKRSIVNEKVIAELFYEREQIKIPVSSTNLYSQNCSANKNELCSTKEDESECTNKKQKYAKSEVACDVTNYFKVSNVFECGRYNTDVSCERSYMATVNNLRTFLTL